MEEPKIPKEYLVNTESLGNGVNQLKYTIEGSDLEIKELKKNIEINLLITKIIKKILIKGTIVFKLELECARCMESSIINFAEEVKSVFLPYSLTAVQSEEETEDPDVNFYKGKTINLMPLIRDTILLAVPIKPICTPSCKGLCPVCGKNLNEGDCGCSRV